MCFIFSKQLLLMRNASHHDHQHDWDGGTEMIHLQMNRLVTGSTDLIYTLYFNVKSNKKEVKNR